MAGSVKTWVNGTTPTCEDDDLNGFELENNNLIEGSGQTLDDTDHDQTHIAVADFAANGNFYTGGGSADAYTAAPVSPREGIHALQNGQQIRFVVPATNTGASTLNVNGLGVKDLKRWDGSACVNGDLISGEIVTVIYNLANTEWRLLNRNSLLSLLPPIGSVIPFMDFDDAVSFDSNYWAYMDGSVLSDSDSLLNGKTLTDLSGRYLVGFGTDGGGDIDTASWSASPVGNAGHTVNLEHNHQWLSGNGGSAPTTWQSDGSSSQSINVYEANGGSTAVFEATTLVTENYYTKDAGSTTQSIQPRSIPCRFIIRIK